MIRVVHLSTGLEAGGAERQLSYLVKGSDCHTFHHIVVSVTNIGPVGAELASEGVEVSCLGMARDAPSPVGLFRLVRLLGRTQPQVLHCWMYHANLLGLIAGKLAGVKSIVWGIRSANPQPRTYSFSTRSVINAGKWTSGFPDCVVVNSEAGKKLHQAWGYKASRMRVIPNGFDLNRFKPDPATHSSVRKELGLAPDSLLIGLIARFKAEKDHAVFCQAAALLTDVNPPVHFLLAGADVCAGNPELRRLISVNGLNGRVHLLGPRDDVQRLDAALDIACLSSWSEAFPNAVGEAMACGVPCVVTAVGDCPRIVGDTGRVIPPRNAKALAAAWTELIEMSPDQRQDLGRKARNRVEENFSLLKAVESYESLYRELTGRQAESGTASH